MLWLLRQPNNNNPASAGFLSSLTHTGSCVTFTSVTREESLLFTLRDIEWAYLNVRFTSFTLSLLQFATRRIWPIQFTSEFGTLCMPALIAELPANLTFRVHIASLQDGDNIVHIPTLIATGSNTATGYEWMNIKASLLVHVDDDWCRTISDNSRYTSFPGFNSHIH